FSSRRRHTRFSRDWSSDVCSSDLDGVPLRDLKIVDVPAEDLLVVNAGNVDRTNDAIKQSIKNNQEWIKRVMDANGLEAAGPLRRSEERRVGNECRPRRTPDN